MQRALKVVSTLAALAGMATAVALADQYGLTVRAYDSWKRAKQACRRFCTGYRSVSETFWRGHL